MSPAKKPARSVFVCQECGYESPRWAGRCPECLSWNTFVERSLAAKAAPHRRAAAGGPPVELSHIDEAAEPRLVIDLPEFNRVLGGGIVPGSLVLIGGDPGIGKSTLVLQVAALAAVTNGQSALYISGEESARQLRMRARRLGLSGDGLFVLTETNLEAALRGAEPLSPGLLIVDSIQTVYTEAALIVGHVTKEGDIAGPRLLEHIVDVVLYLEGERFSSYRLLRGVKNRYGSVAEVGVFEMTGGGLIGVENPSEVFLAERSGETVGSMIVPTIEGSRPLLVEVQALTSPTATPAPRRTANGLDLGRLLLVTAVLSRRVGLSLGGQDIIASVVGGLRVQEPAADLGLALAIASSHRDRPLPPELVAVGEVGLSGELRSVAQLERRLAEAERLGFRRCLLPEAALRRQQPKTGMELLPAASVREAIRLALGGRS